MGSAKELSSERRRFEESNAGNAWSVCVRFVSFLVASKANGRAFYKHVGRSFDLRRFFSQSTSKSAIENFGAFTKRENTLGLFARNFRISDPNIYATNFDCFATAGEKSREREKKIILEKKNRERDENWEEVFRKEGEKRIERKYLRESKWRHLNSFCRRWPSKETRRRPIRTPLRWVSRSFKF